MAGTLTCRTGKTLIMTQQAVSQHHQCSSEREAMKKKNQIFYSIWALGRNKKWGKTSVDM